MAEIFDDWPEKYDLWFETPMGRLIKGYESELVLRMLAPGPDDEILAAFRRTRDRIRELLAERFGDEAAES